MFQSGRPCNSKRYVFAVAIDSNAWCDGAARPIIAANLLGGRSMYKISPDRCFDRSKSSVFLPKILLAVLAKAPDNGY